MFSVICLSALVAAAADPQPQGLERLAVAPNKCRVTVFENAEELATVEPGTLKFFVLKLAQPTNVVGLLTEAEAGTEGAWVELAFDSLKQLPDPTGPWLAGSPDVEGWLTSPKPPPGFRPVPVRNRRLAVPAGRRAFRQMIARPQPGPPWFPKSKRAYACAGSRQLIKPYFPDMGIPLAYDYRLTVGLPAGMLPAACDGGVGAKPSRVRVNRVGKTTFARLYYSGPPASPFGIYICWQDKNSVTIKYQPVIRIGGTYGWRRLTATVRPPAGAAFARPIVLKWAADKVVGEAWIDNIVLRAADDKSKTNLLPAGNFDGDQWKGTAGIEKTSRDGSNCLHAVLSEDRIDATRGWWVPPKGKVAIRPEKTYVLEADVRAEGLHVKGSRPHAAVLVACPDDAAAGDYQVIIEGASWAAGARVLPTRAPFTVLPHLRGRRPERVRIMPCYYSDPFTDPQVIRAFAENAYNSGITWTLGRADNALVKILAARNHKVVCVFGRQPFVVGGTMQAYLEKHPDLQALWFDGKRRKTVACPTWFLSPQGARARQELQSEIKARLATGNYAGFDWDIEQPVVDPPTFCVCPRCLGAFRKFAGLPADFDLKTEFLLKEPLRSKWVAFRCHQNAQLAKLVAEWVKQLRPGIEFSVYSGYQSRRTMEHYGVDWRLLAPVVDAALSGYGFNAEQQRATMQAVGGKPYLGGELYYLSPTSDASAPPRPETWAVSLLRQIAFTGGHGVVIWELPVFDAAAFYQTSVAADIVARYELFFTQGTRCEDELSVDGLEGLSWFALKRKNQVMVLLLNFSGDEVEVKLASDLWQVPATVRLRPYSPRVILADKKTGGAPQPPAASQ